MSLMKCESMHLRQMRNMNRQTITKLLATERNEVHELLHLLVPVLETRYQLN